ncbi:UDP-N-acetylmuramoyl-tripeptide--D-alanyl-D-alanine ligase [Candidatus Daviesbacteria bacterium]|nr:UDP-N-acetylmuramoyl-tripeptide--D-alanyl-D-alanine ligase [Candidatus Daviesbacteria bacterium]
MELKHHPAWGNIKTFKKPAHLARFFLAKKIAQLYPRSTFIGITGSVGKTTTKEACLQILSQKYKTLASVGNIDPLFNIPSTLLKIRPGIKKVILEMGIEYPGEMDFYLSIVAPATAIVTRIYFAHSEFLGNINQILEEKGKLVKLLPKDGFAILNWDDIYTRKLAKATVAQVLFYGTNKDECHVWASNVRLENNQTKFGLNYGVERVEVALNLLGRHFIYPALAAATLGLNSGLSLINIKKGLENLQPVVHRLELLSGLGDWDVLDDTYNASPAAVEEAVNVLDEISARRRIVVLGEMRELGVYSEQMHREVARKLYKDKIDLVFLGSGETKYIADELLKLGFSPERMEANLSNNQIVSKILRIVKNGDVILIKGSRAVKLDEVVKRITKKR